MSQFPSFAEFKTFTTSKQTKIFDILFEHTESLIKFTLDKKDTDFDISRLNSFEELIELVRIKLLTLVTVDNQYKSELSNIIAAHPKLGVPKKIQGELSELSKQEQKNLGDSKNYSPEIKEALIKLNDEYEDKYKGLRFVCFVNGRDRVEIIKEMKSILSSENTWNQEAERAINAMCDIALDRVKKL